MAKSRLFIAAPLIGILIVAFGFLIDKGIDILTLDNFVLSALAVLVVAMGSAFISTWLYRQHSEDDLHEQISQLKEEHIRFKSTYTEISQNLTRHIDLVRMLVEPRPYTWLLSQSDLIHVEETTQADEIWIVSPDLRYDILSDNKCVRQITDIIKKNAERGITYCYIVPDNHGMRIRVGQLKETFQDYPNNMSVKLIPNNNFRLLADTHISVYNPRGKGGEPVRTFLELPVEDGSFWVEFDREKSIEIAGRIADIFERE